MLVDDLDLPVHDDVFLVDAEHGVGLEELENGVHAFALDGVVLQEGVLAVDAFLVGEGGVGLER